MPLVRVGTTGVEPLREEQYESEAELEDVLAEHVQLLLEGDDPALALVTRQLTLPGSGVADLVLVDESGVPVVVEVKLGRNPQSRREVIAQVFDYASALTDWTVDELDERTGGKIEGALRKLLDDDEVAFRARWRVVATNLRAGMVRVIVAVDEQTDELSRVVSFINDHSDLDVRLVVVEKYGDPNGDTIFSSTTPILSDDQAVASRARDTTRRSPTSKALQAVLDAYQGLEHRPLELFGKGRTYRRLLHQDWPASLHYEFLCADGETFAEIHIEGDDTTIVAPKLRELAGKLEGHFSHATCSFDPEWYRGRGRLRVMHDETATPEVIAANMVRLIEATTDRISKVLVGTKT